MKGLAHLLDDAGDLTFVSLASGSQTSTGKWASSPNPVSWGGRVARAEPVDWLGQLDCQYRGRTRARENQLLGVWDIVGRCLRLAFHLGRMRGRRKLKKKGVTACGGGLGEGAASPAEEGCGWESGSCLFLRC